MSEFQKKPEIVIFAELNGSGKSTFTQLLKPPMDYSCVLTDISNVERKDLN